MNFFSPDSKFTKMMTALGEMMLLNACWILASIPLITMGAASTAMYAVMRRRLQEEDNGTVRPFFRAFGGNLKTGTLFWAAQVFITVSLGSMFLIPVGVFLKVIAAVLLVLVTLVFSVIYPQIARFRNRWFAYLRNAVILLLTRTGWVLLNLLLALTPGIVFLLAPAEFLQLGFIWLLFGFSMMFLLSAEIMQKVLEPMEEMASGKRT